ncbi:MAG: carboxypeptidase-like regulatory domain-containing protein [Planctomycetota bacterium]|nr:carboxypeptidase-like regulatory domain-containing protein [Planctomycetota bacterium]
MVLRLAVLVAAEAVLAVFLAVQMFAEPEPAHLPAATGERPDLAEPAPPASAAAVSTTASANERTGTPPAPARIEAAAKWNPDDPIGVLLTGTVRWRDGRPVAEPSVSASLQREQRSASGGKDGGYALVGLSPGEWNVTFRADGTTDSKQTLVVTDDAVQHRDFILDESHPVRVLIVTADGQDGTHAVRLALPGIDLHVVGQTARFPERFAPSDADAVIVGDAKWDSVMNPRDGFAGTLQFASAPPAHAALLLRHLVLDQQVVQLGQTEVKFVIDAEALKKLGGSVTLRVVDADTGAPLTSASVALSTTNASRVGMRVDAEGRLTIESLTPGLLHCKILAADHEQMNASVSIESGQRTDLGEVRLGAKLPLVGRIVDADGKPAPARVTWTDLKWRTSPRGFERNRFASAGTDGMFSLPYAGRGPIAVSATGGAPDTPTIARAVVDNPPQAPVELRLVPGTQLRVALPNDATRGFTVTLYDAHRRVLASASTGPIPGQPITLVAEPGSYAYTVHDHRGQLVQEGTVQLGAEPATLEVR